MVVAFSTSDESDTLTLQHILALQMYARCFLAGSSKHDLVSAGFNCWPHHDGFCLAV